MITRLIARNEVPFRHPADLIGVITLLAFSVMLAPGALHGGRADRTISFAPVAANDVQADDADTGQAEEAARKQAALEAAFDTEAAMDTRSLMKRWDPLIAKAARRFNISERWIRDVMRMESGGRTMLDRNTRIVSHAGAMGLMQVMPQTYREMRAIYGLGRDAYSPQNNVFAGAAYLKILYRKYGYPAMFAAYNAGPGSLEDHLYRGRALPDETRNYVAGITGHAGPLTSDASHAARRVSVNFNDTDVARLADALSRVAVVRIPLPDRYSGGMTVSSDTGMVAR